MTPKPREEIEVIHVKSNSGRIDDIADGRLMFRDDGGNARAIALDRCAEAYLARHVRGKIWRRRNRETGAVVDEPIVLEEGPRPVGFRQLVSDPPRVRLLADPDLWFVFESIDAAYERLLAPLAEHGYRTLDLD